MSFVSPWLRQEDNSKTFDQRMSRLSAAVLVQNMKGAADNSQCIRKLEGLTKVLAEDVHK